MKTTLTYTIIFLALLGSQVAWAQDYETSANSSEETDNKSSQVYDTDEKEESLSAEELRALEKESKKKEKAALQEAKEAKQLERQIQKTKNAEARAIKARKTADEQAERTKSAIEDYLKE